MTTTYLVAWAMLDEDSHPVIKTFQFNTLDDLREWQALNDAGTGEYESLAIVEIESRPARVSEIKGVL